MHALLRSAWGDAQDTVCISHMHTSHGVPPLLLAASWLRGAPTEAPVECRHSGTSNTACSASARAAVQVLNAAVVQAQNDSADSDGSTASSSRGSHAP